MTGNKLQLSLFAQTDVGRERDHNEDNFLLAPDLGLAGENRWHVNYDQQTYQVGAMGTLLVVADGMGGTNAGEVASDIAVKSIKQFFDKVTGPVSSHEQIRKHLTDAIHFANNSIIKHGRDNPETSGMGTTLILGWILGDLLTTAWIGDSRAYLSRNRNGIKAISQDHSYVQELVDRGEITAEQAFFHPQSNVITQSLGDGSMPINPSVSVTRLQRGDRVLLCSDGLNGMLQDAEIANLLNLDDNVKDSTHKLIDQANEAGGHDNITLAICEICSDPQPLIIAPGSTLNASVPGGPVTPTGTITGQKSGWLVWVLALALLALSAYVLVPLLTGAADDASPKGPTEDATTMPKDSAALTGAGPGDTLSVSVAPSAITIPPSPSSGPPPPPREADKQTTPQTAKPTSPAPKPAGRTGDSAAKESAETIPDNDAFDKPDSDVNPGELLEPDEANEDKKARERMDQLNRILDGLKLTPQGLGDNFTALRNSTDICDNLDEIVSAYEDSGNKVDVAELVEFYKVQCKSVYQKFENMDKIKDN